MEEYRDEWGRGAEPMVEKRKNGSDTERCADAHAEVCAVSSAELFAECCAVVRADLYADNDAEIMVDN